jgi:hypothetical protein
MFLGSRPASGTRIGTAAWPYNAQTAKLASSLLFSRISNEKRLCIWEDALGCGAVGSVIDRIANLSFWKMPLHELSLRDVNAGNATVQ